MKPSKKQLERNPLKHKTPKKSTVIIGIVGASGSGKTTIARDLATALKTTCFLSQDNYYKNLPADADSNAWNFDDPATIDLAHLARDLAALKHGETIEHPHYLFSEHKRAPETTTIHPAQTIVVEGLFLFTTPALRDIFDFKIYINVPQKTCLARRIARDCAERARNEETIRKRWAEQVEPMFHKHIEPTKTHADRVTDSSPRGTPEYTKQLLDLFQALKEASLMDTN